MKSITSFRAFFFAYTVGNSFLSSLSEELAGFAPSSFTLRLTSAKKETGPFFHTGCFVVSLTFGEQDARVGHALGKRIVKLVEVPILITTATKECTRECFRQGLRAFKAV